MRPRGLCANAQRARGRPSDARAVGCRRRLGATCVFDNQAKSEEFGVQQEQLHWMTERWTSRRGRTWAHVVSYVENTSDESVGAEKLLSWALKDDYHHKGPPRHCRADCGSGSSSRRHSDSVVTNGGAKWSTTWSIKSSINRGEARDGVDLRALRVKCLQRRRVDGGTGHRRHVVCRR